MGQFSKMLNFGACLTNTSLNWSFEVDCSFLSQLTWFFSHLWFFCKIGPRIGKIFNSGVPADELRKNWSSQVAWLLNIDWNFNNKLGCSPTQQKNCSALKWSTLAGPIRHRLIYRWSVGPLWDGWSENCLQRQEVEVEWSGKKSSGWSLPVVVHLSVRLFTSNSSQM